MRKLSALFSLLCCVGCPPTDRQADGPGEGEASANSQATLAAADEYTGVPQVVGDSLLRFPGGGEYSPGFRHISYIGQIPARSKAPFIIVRGIECSFCDAPPSVLMRSPSDGSPMNLRSQPGWYPYPGRIVAWDNPAIILSEARVFWGECLPGQAALLFYNTDFIDNQPAGRTVRATFISGDSLLIADGAVPWSSLETVSERAGGGSCHEIEPENRFDEP